MQDTNNDKPASSTDHITNATPNRMHLIDPAVRFLKDDQVKGASVAKKIAFLESKGLSSSEIELAMAQANTPPNVPAPSYPVPATQASSATWSFKEFLIWSSTLGGIGYAAFVFISKYVLPAIPSIKDLTDSHREFRNAIKATSQSIAELQAQAALSLAQLQHHTDSIKKYTEDTQHELATTTLLIKDRDLQYVQLADQINDIKLAVPKLLDSYNHTQQQVLTELQADLKSLRGDITAADTNLVPSSLPVGVPKLPDWQVRAAQSSMEASTSSSSSQSHSVDGGLSYTTPTSI